MIGQSPRDGVRAARGMLQKSKHIHNANSRAKAARRAITALQSELRELEALEDDEAPIKDTLDAQIAEIESLRLAVSKEKKRVAWATQTSHSLAAQVKKLEQELLDTGEEARRALADVAIEIAELKQELDEERARCSANGDAKQELEKLKQKLREMCEGPE
ncbi:hypothetical protein GT037_009871 [Alternaria burnsii]|uniref:Uncharacterized protein n=1 Tax=Alternaria burnsii TaxID=1187904 RepID=A0A8H7AZC4_9PLEO|nr:uncharacterized protein GT037_009871 [Alternaria burnsii]KAF7671972.1 hypothetical protein GT037_009871 [Alternaria burnsii]CAI9630038.1 unnamed protein product [Alternaria burnsii]